MKVIADNRKFGRSFGHPPPKENLEKAEEELDKLIESHPDNTDFRQMMNLVEFFRT